MQSILIPILDANWTTFAGRTIGAAVAAVIVVVDIATFIIIAYLVTNKGMIEAAAVTIAVVRLRMLAVSFVSEHLLLEVGLHFSYLMDPFTFKVADLGINVVIQRLLDYFLDQCSMN